MVYERNPLQIIELLTPGLELRLGNYKLYKRLSADNLKIPVLPLLRMVISCSRVSETVFAGGAL